MRKVIIFRNSNVLISKETTYHDGPPNKVKDLDIQFQEKLKEQYQDEKLEIEIRINTDQGNCAGKEMDEDLFWEIIEKFDWGKDNTFKKRNNPSSPGAASSRYVFSPPFKGA